MAMHFPDCFYFNVIQGQDIVNDLFESNLRLLIRIRCLCIKSYRVVGKILCIQATLFISKSRVPDKILRDISSLR